jgi:hypothetical protein
VGGKSTREVWDEAYTKKNYCCGFEQQLVDTKLATMYFTIYRKKLHRLHRIDEKNVAHLLKMAII